MSLTAEQRRLVEDNSRLVPWAVGRYYRMMPEAEREDALQNGFLGLCHAATKFDPSRARFSTYATWWIRNYIDKGRVDYRLKRKVGVDNYQPPMSLSATFADSDTTLADVVAIDRTSAEEHAVDAVHLEWRRAFALGAEMRDIQHDIIATYLANPDARPKDIDVAVAQRWACSAEHVGDLRRRAYEAIRRQWRAAS